MPPTTLRRENLKRACWSSQSGESSLFIAACSSQALCYSPSLIFSKVESGLLFSGKGKLISFLQVVQ